MPTAYEYFQNPNITPYQTTQLTSPATGLVPQDTKNRFVTGTQGVTRPLSQIAYRKDIPFADLLAVFNSRMNGPMTWGDQDPPPLLTSVLQDSPPSGLSGSNQALPPLPNAPQARGKAGGAGGSGPTFDFSIKGQPFGQGVGRELGSFLQGGGVQRDTGPNSGYTRPQGMRPGPGRGNPMGGLLRQLLMGRLGLR